MISRQSWMKTLISSIICYCSLIVFEFFTFYFSKSSSLFFTMEYFSTMYIYSCLKTLSTCSDLALKNSSIALRCVFRNCLTSTSCFFLHSSNCLPKSSYFCIASRLRSVDYLVSPKVFSARAAAVRSLFLNLLSITCQKSWLECTELRSSLFWLLRPKFASGLLCPLYSKSDSIARSYSSIDSSS